MSSGAALRVYTTDVNADTLTRQQLSLVLLAHARLGVLMVGELPPHAMTTQLRPLRDRLTRGAWPNRDMLMVPLGSATTLAAQGAQLSAGSGVNVRVTPQAARPTDAWSFISGTWNRLQGANAAERDYDIRRAVPTAAAVPMPEAPTQPMALAPEPDALRRRPRHPPARAGANSRCAAPRSRAWWRCCVFDMQSAAARWPMPAPSASGDRLSEQGRLMLEALSASTRTLGAGQRPARGIGQRGPRSTCCCKPMPGPPGRGAAPGAAGQRRVTSRWPACNWSA